ncbi:MAG: T9SS type A sorting domain-containing protein [Flavobacteriales bacterium]|nr:T9SS type A sorting domain-containing protein [Bacteroidota bacterium]MCB9241372.1 T9SS type A sorting domain-containing protein [Flavobacteriales bacterium]
MKRTLLLLCMVTLFVALGTLSSVGAADNHTVTSVHGEKVKLGQNYPNPAVGRTYIEVDFEGEEATLTVYNVVGKLIEERVVTSKLIVLDVSQYDEGIYLYTLEANGEKITKRMTVKKQ